MLLTIVIVLLVYLCVRVGLNEHHRCQLKYMAYASIVMLFSIVLPPVYLFRPRNVCNIRLAARCLNPFLRLFGFDYSIENGHVLLNDRPCIIVANHQSSLDFIGMMYMWPKYVRVCTILAKKELIWAGPFGPSSWLAGVEFVDRKNRQRAIETLNRLTAKIRQRSLRMWIFPEGSLESFEYA
jgi:lysophosphatidate acyltransferase